MPDESLGVRSGALVTASDRPTQPVNLLDFEPLARARLSHMAYEYLSGGGGNEVTLGLNRARLDAILLQPRVLAGAGAIDTRIEMFGRELPHPILLAPTAFHKLFHPEGEIATARGAAAAGATLVASTLSTTSIEEIARAASGPLWFQLYVQRDRGFTRELVERAEKAGCQALVITADTPVLGTRDRERRAGMALPPGLEMANLRGLAAAAESGRPFHENIYNPFLAPDLTWKDVAEIRSWTKVPVLLKGILAPEDALLALEHGAAGIIVSNHGGRNLDTAPASIDALPRVAEAVAGRVPVLLDGGIRRGTDVIKALAMGARAVLIGRPYLWGLAVDGANGVRRVVEMLLSELEIAMAFCGAARLSQIDARLLWPGDGR